MSDWVCACDALLREPRTFATNLKIGGEELLDAEKGNDIFLRKKSDEREGGTFREREL